MTDFQKYTMEEALAGMMYKHTVSLYDMIRSKKLYTTDKWDEKINDHIIYLLLLRTIVDETNYGVSSSPKTVYNGMIWLEEQDDKYAAELLIAYQNQQISKLETRIDNHKYIIETLNKMIEEEYSDD